MYLIHSDIQAFIQLSHASIQLVYIIRTHELSRILVGNGNALDALSLRRSRKP